MNRIAFPLSLLLCGLASGWVLYAFSFFLSGPTAHMSDVTFHLSILREMDKAVKGGANPLDFWYDLSPFGVPLFRTYQHLPHLILYCFFRTLGESIDLEVLLRWSTVLLTVLLPWSAYLGSRLLGLPWLACGFAGLMSIGVAEAGDYGLGIQNFTWGTGGIVTQLWAVVFFFPAFGFCVRYLTQGRSLGWALLFGFLSCGSHLVCAVGLGISLAVIVVFSPALWRGNAMRRTLVLAAGLLIVIAYQWVLIVRDSLYHHQSIHEPIWKFSGLGLAWVKQNFWSGDLFDLSRFPSLTILVLIGLCALATGVPLINAASERKPWRISLLVIFMVWILLLCGWDLWGELLRDNSIFSTFHIHRLIVVVHIFGIFAAAYGVSALLKWPVATFPFLIVLMITVFRERHVRMEQAQQWLEEARHAQQSDTDLPWLIAALHALPRGYVHVGMEKNWAKELRIGENLPLRDVLIGEGFPTFAMLYHAFELSGDVLFDFDPSRESHYQLFAVRYTVAPPSWQPPAFLTFKERFGRYVLYEYSPASVLSPAIVSFQVPTLSDAAQRAEYMRTWVNSPLSDTLELGSITQTPWTTPLPVVPIDKLVEIAAGVHPQSSINSITMPYAGDISAEGSCHDKEVLLLKTGFHPGWQATLNGSIVPTMWVTPGFLAIPCSQHTFTLKLEYQSGMLKSILFGISIIVLIIGFISDGRRSTH